MGSLEELHEFFSSLYSMFYSSPETLGIPEKPDIFFEIGELKKHKPDISKWVKKPRQMMGLSIEYLYMLGVNGEISGNRLVLEDSVYDEFFVKKPRVKQKVEEALSTQGTKVEKSSGITVTNDKYPQMMPALKELATACSKITDKRLALFLFTTCDFRAFGEGYQLDSMSLIKAVTRPKVYDLCTQLVNYMKEKSYEPIVKIDSIHGWKIGYKGDKRIKTSPLLELEFDERNRHPIRMQVKMASFNRLTPHLENQPEDFQEELMTHSFKCNNCGWCKTRKSMHPTVVEYKGEKQVICWYYTRYLEVTQENVELVKKSVNFHEALKS